jgi:purine-binding chemotaxis protein CheW
VEGIVTGDLKQYVLFRLRAEDYGLPIAAVQSIIRYETPTPVPRAPEGVDGVINLRGQVIPVIDLGLRLLGAPLEPQASSRIIVAESAVGPVGLAVDAAFEVASIAAEEIREAPRAALDAVTSEAFEGVVTRGERLVILLYPDKVLPRTTFAAGAPAGEEDTDV